MVARTAATRWTVLPCIVMALLGMATAPVRAEPVDAPLNVPLSEWAEALTLALPGGYAIVGQLPEGGPTYAGTARIVTDADGAHLRLQREVDGRRVEVELQPDRARPGEGFVLRLRWPGSQASCLPMTDLDNRVRLSCYHWETGSLPKRPGLETWYPTDDWPDARDRPD